jgi:hypothetical protein
MTLSGSEASLASLAFFKNVKHAAKTNIPGADTVAGNLEILFGEQKKARLATALWLG